jgi:hypothetical protein
LLLADSSLLGVDLGANLAFFGQGRSIHDQFHAAGFASSVFLGAVLSEVAPLPATAGHLVCVVETHFDQAVDGELSAYSEKPRSHMKLGSTLEGKLTGCQWTIVCWTMFEDEVFEELEAWDML